MRALTALYAIALIAVMPAEAQKAQTAAPSAAVPSDAPSASAKPTLPDGLEWSSLGATARCRDRCAAYLTKQRIPHRTEGREIQVLSAVVAHPIVFAA